MAAISPKDHTVTQRGSVFPAEMELGPGPLPDSIKEVLNRYFVQGIGLSHWF